MARRAKQIEIIEVEIEKLISGGLGEGITADGHKLAVRYAPPGACLSVRLVNRRKKTWRVERIEMLRPPPEMVEPVCKVFGLCGGCMLQELPLHAQRQHKLNYALESIVQALGIDLSTLHSRVRVHPMRGDTVAYRYRNKIELTWGNRCILSRADFEADRPFYGQFLGFHAAGHFDRIADTDHCWLVSEAANAILGCLRKLTLTSASPPALNQRTHQGFWRHAAIREGYATGEMLVGIYTTSPETDEQIQAVTNLAEQLMSLALPDGRRLVGVLWLENDGFADVARGSIRQIWGQHWFCERLGDVEYKLSMPSFFQTSTYAAEILYQTIREAIGGASGGTLCDLYCGIGSIGLFLASDFTRIIGIEEVPEAVEDARLNAALNRVTWAEYHTASVEKALHYLPDNQQDITVILDPPRVGLHPKVAATVAEMSAQNLIYVACHPPSLGRDAAILAQGGWHITDLWAVDLFPQTGHIELVARFARS